jgi:hypothetical protein
MRINESVGIAARVNTIGVTKGPLALSVLTTCYMNPLAL